MLCNPASNRNEYQEYFLRGKGGRCVALPSCVDYLEIQVPHHAGTLRARTGIALPLPLHLYCAIHYICCNTQKLHGENVLQNS